MPSRTYPKISIIGAGRVGSSLAAALHARGYPVVSIINRRGSAAIALAKSVQCMTVSTRIADIDATSRIVFITVPDDTIAGAVKQLALVRRLKFANLFVAHTSGVHSSLIMAPLMKKGALAASMHPIQTFPGRSKRSMLKGIYFGIEGAPAALACAQKIAHDLGAKTVVVPEASKPLYHVACVFSSAYLVAVLNVIHQLASTIGLKVPWTKVFGPLMTSAMENTIRHSAGDALTGPVMRGDLSTIALHLKSLAAHAPQFVPFYLVAGIEVARIASEQGKLTHEEFRKMVNQFRKILTSIPTFKSSKGK